jgi:hypothetical protein
VYGRKELTRQTREAVVFGTYAEGAPWPPHSDLRTEAGDGQATTDGGLAIACRGDRGASLELVAIDRVRLLIYSPHTLLKLHVHHLHEHDRLCSCAVILVTPSALLPRLRDDTPEHTFLACSLRQAFRKCRRLVVRCAGSAQLGFGDGSR